MENQSHLSVLILRVRDEEERHGYVHVEALVNLAEYILSWPGKYTKQEYDQAIIILASYHLAKLASRRHGWKYIQEELAKPYKARCRRCGLPISSKISLATGYGHICRKKLGLKPQNPQDPHIPQRDWRLTEEDMIRYQDADPFRSRFDQNK